MASQLQDLIEETRRLCTEKGWREPFRNGVPIEGPWFSAYIALAHSELSEAQDAYRDKVWSGSETRYTEAITKTSKPISGQPVSKPIGVGPELADTLIRILDMCDIWGIDIEYELRRVLDYGWTRPYKHGGRQL